MNNDINDRKRAAALGRAYQEKKIAWQQFMDETADFRDDDLIEELIDLIEHEPKRGGLMGASEKEWFEYQRAIWDTIATLEK